MRYDLTNRAMGTPSADIRETVPFFGVTNMEASLRFYVGGLGFKMKLWWIPEAEERNAERRIRWCRLERGGGAIMLQEYLPEKVPDETLGTGISVCFMCEDALVLYREFSARGVQTLQRPFVGNHLWVVSVADPDGYRIDFESPTDLPEETEFQE